ncbi:pyridoxal phosphate-dependent aminotransferase [Pollutibacter soli]|uniref:pyridoxal phosphate-dependent aminotransferase n=1 Tax=Pollutibacter soli TaxID=3034157 RepID=UPI003013C4AF
MERIVGSTQADSGSIGDSPLLSHLSGTLIGSEIVKMNGDIKEKIRAGEKIFNYTIGDFDPSIFSIPAELEEEIIYAYRKHFTNYPLGEGETDLRQAICKFISDREKLNYKPEEVLVASGGRPLIYTVYRTIVDKGEKVIYAVPSWNNNHYVHFVEGEHCAIETTAENNFMPTADDIQPHLKGAVLLALCSPLNPTGTTFSREQLEEICAMVLKENQSRGASEKKLFILFDQMYWLMTYGTTEHYNPVSLFPDLKPYTIFVDGISKCFAATGVRLGWSIGPAFIINKMKSILSHLGAWSPLPEQKATAKYLLQKGAIDQYLKIFKAGLFERLQKIHAGFQQMKKDGFTVDSIAPQAAIYLTVKIEAVGKKNGAGVLLEKQSDVTAYLLNQAGLALVPFSAFGASHTSPWYRLSVGTVRIEDLHEMFGKLRDSLKKLN